MNWFFRRISLVALAFVFLTACDPIEQKYLARGSFTTAVIQNTGPDGAYTIYYPTELGQGGQKHAIVTWGNGTYGFPAVYAILGHWASHGMVVIASNDLFVTAEQMTAGIDYMLAQNTDPQSLFFDQLDTSAIGASGHSRGGGRSIDVGNDPRVSCIAPIEPSAGNAAGLVAEMFVVAGENDTSITPAFVQESAYDPSPVPTIYGVLGGANHLTPLLTGGGFKGYVTAWFGHCLQNDPEAADAFFGDCSLCENENWVVQRKNGP